MVLSREFTDAVRVNMITKKDFDYIKDAASREDSFDWEEGRRRFHAALREDVFGE